MLDALSDLLQGMDARVAKASSIQERTIFFFISAIKLFHPAEQDVSVLHLVSKGRRSLDGDGAVVAGEHPVHVFRYRLPGQKTDRGDDDETCQHGEHPGVDGGIEEVGKERVLKADAQYGGQHELRHRDAEPGDEGRPHRGTGGLFPEQTVQEGREEAARQRAPGALDEVVLNENMGSTDTCDTADAGIIDLAAADNSVADDLIGLTETMPALCPNVDTDAVGPVNSTIFDDPVVAAMHGDSAALRNRCTGSCMCADKALDLDVGEEGLIRSEALLTAGQLDEVILDVAVVGAGHAGIEAALAAARLGVDTILFTMSLDAVGNMPCNPSVGGTGKGHLVFEIDALGGEMGRAADAVTLQSRTLNQGKGPAVWSKRIQADRQKYRLYMKKTLEAQPHLRLVQAEISDILCEGEGDGRHITGVVTELGGVYAVQAGIVWREVPVYLVGVAVAAVSGYLCIRLLKLVAEKGKFGAFAYYCWAVGILALVLNTIVK